MIGVGSNNQVITLPTLRKIFSRVINDVVRANRSRRVHFPRTAHGSDLSPERFGSLDGKRTHTARRAINQNLVASLDLSPVTKTLKGGGCRHGQGCRVLKRYLVRLQCYSSFRGTRILD